MMNFVLFVVFDGYTIYFYILVFAFLNVTPIKVLQDP